MATDTEIVRRVNDILMDFNAEKWTAYETLVKITRAVILRDVSR